MGRAFIYLCVVMLGFLTVVVGLPQVSPNDLENWHYIAVAVLTVGIAAIHTFLKIDKWQKNVLDYEMILEICEKIQNKSKNNKTKKEKKTMQEIILDAIGKL